MKIESNAGKPRGIINPFSSSNRVKLSRQLPAADLKPVLEHFWIVEWDFSDQPAYVAETLPHPSVHYVIEKKKSRIVGIVSGKFSVVLEGKGMVFGIKFKPGAFYQFIKYPVANLTDRIINPLKVFGPEADIFENDLLSLMDKQSMYNCAEDFIRRSKPQTDNMVDLINRIIECIIMDTGILTVESLVKKFNIQKRALQRIFNLYVGIGPKWVIRRYRLHEALERLHEGNQVNFSELAYHLRYSDQAHFIKDFKTLVGKTPAEYTGWIGMSR